MKRKNGQIICLDCRQWSSQSDKVNKGKTNVDQKGKKKTLTKTGWKWEGRITLS